MTTKLIFLEEIDFKDSPKVRAAEPNPEVVEQYARSYGEKVDMPPIVVFFDAEDKKYRISDGVHRCNAVKSLGRKAIMAQVYTGPFNEALRYALMANTSHGLMRSNADKRQCCRSALMQWPDVSNSQIAQMVAVDDKTVDSVRTEMEKKKQIKKSPKRLGADGKMHAAKHSDKKEDEEEEEEDKPRVKVLENIFDKLNRPIPINALGYWNRSEEVQKLLTDISNVIGTLKQVSRDSDIMYAEVNTSGTIADLERAYISIRTAMPYAVCTACQGHPETQKAGCRMCFGRGLISEFRYKTLVTEETKTILEKAKKK